MAIDLPTQLTGIIKPRRFLRGNPVVSGDALADRPYGSRSVQSGQNHVYGNRIRAWPGIASVDNVTAFFSDAAGSIVWTDLTGQIEITLAPDVVEFQVDAHIRRGSIRISFDDGTPIVSAASAVIGAVTAKATTTLTIPTTTGVSAIVKVQYLRVATFTFDAFSLEPYEIEMVAVDFPT